MPEFTGHAAPYFFDIQSVEPIVPDFICLL